MIAVDSAHAGTDVRFRVLCYDTNDALSDADAVPLITITRGEPGLSTAVITAAALTHVGTGTYDYWWDTTGLPEDTYLINAPSNVDGRTVQNQAEFRIR